MEQTREREDWKKEKSCRFETTVQANECGIGDWIGELRAESYYMVYG